VTDVKIRKTARLSGEVCAPPSKSYTQRMLIAAALSHGISKISGPLNSDDNEATLRAVRALGANVEVKRGCWTVTGTAKPKAADSPIDCGESGATLRFMVPVAALADGPSTLLFAKSFENRPVEPLLQSLRSLGAKTFSGSVDCKSCVKVEGGGIEGGETSIAGDVSSQFISGLLFACPLARRESEIRVTTPLESKGYVEMTREVLSQHGVTVSVSDDFRQICIPAGQTYKPCDHRVPGDFSSAAFLLAAAAITRSDVTVNNLDYQLVQGDKAIVCVLKQMGVEGKVCRCSIEISSTGEPLKPLDVNARDTPDLVPVYAALASYAEGRSAIRGAARLRLKESDRLESLHVELGKMGAEIDANADSLVVNGPCKLHGAEIDPHNDHRIAMACAIAALGAEGETVIHNAECVQKSYPRFFIDLRSLGVDLVGGKFNR
jgi:3-phosphoshikimate 1-carboxyvinyltransferase